jgi:hypothetical protein
METKNYYVALTYDLKVGEEDELMESTTAENPFTFYSGLGMVLEDFENAIMACEVDGTFDFTIPADRAYGEYDDDSVIDLPKNIFMVNGKIDDEILFEGNIGFYGKSGFDHASKFQIRYNDLPAEADTSFFLCKELIPGYLDGITGAYRTPLGYYVDQAKAEEFDKNFPFKEKKKLPGQLNK